MPPVYETRLILEVLVAIGVSGMRGALIILISFNLNDSSCICSRFSSVSRIKAPTLLFVFSNLR